MISQFYLYAQVLWPYLLELVVPEKFTDGAGVLCRCLATIAKKKREENAEDYELDYETQGKKTPLRPCCSPTNYKKIQHFWKRFLKIP